MADQTITTESKRPIFLHSGFRSGSTWFWHRFRECAGVYGYCEPFNVKLAFLQAREIAANRPDAWPSGHPLSIRPYFAEYEPLLQPGSGVRLFEPRFGVETYFQIEADPAMERYVASLLDQGRSLEKLPVLGFCCSLGRVQWFRRHLDGINIVTWRNPRDQWMSSHKLWTEHGNFHFEAHYLLVAYIARLYPELAAFFDEFGALPTPDEIAPTMDLFTAPAGVARRFRVFLRVFVLDMLLAIEHADLVVDLDRMSASEPYRDSGHKRAARSVGPRRSLLRRLPPAAPRVRRRCRLRFHPAARARLPRPSRPRARGPHLPPVAALRARTFRQPDRRRSLTLVSPAAADRPRSSASVRAARRSSANGGCRECGTGSRAGTARNARCRPPPP